MSDSIVINAYRRIRDAFDKGRGVRLTAEEVAHIWTLDDAIRAAVERSEEEKEDPTVAPFIKELREAGRTEDHNWMRKNIQIPEA